jgi:hypothetical protein
MKKQPNLTLPPQLSANLTPVFLKSTFPLSAVVSPASFEVGFIIALVHSVFQRSTCTESVIHIGDGQGRAFGFHSLERSIHRQVTKLLELIKKKERAGQGVTADRRELDALETQLRHANDRGAVGLRQCRQGKKLCA